MGADATSRVLGLLGMRSARNAEHGVNSSFVAFCRAAGATQSSTGLATIMRAILDSGARDTGRRRRRCSTKASR